MFWQSISRLTVLLLVPFYSFWPRYETKRAGCPIGLELIASELIAKGFNVIFIDACMAAYNQLTEQLDGTVRYGLTDKQLAKVLERFNPAIVGITSLFSNQAESVEAVAGIVHQAYPDAIIVEGGGHATGDLEGVLASPNVDMLVNREGLITFPELCASIEARHTTKYKTSVEGVSYKTEAGQSVHNPDRPFIKNLDVLAPRRLEIPLHTMYNVPEHTGGSRHVKYGRLAYVLTSMGCPLHCDFCFIPTLTGTIRYFSLARFEQDVVRLKEAGVTEIVVEDDMLFDNMPRALQIGEILHRHGMVWFEEGGLSMFKFMKPGYGLTYQDVLTSLATNGLYRFYLAIESANKDSLAKSHKPDINSEAGVAEEIVRYAAKKGIEAVGGFMLGFKGRNGGGLEFEETREDIERTVAYAKRLKEAGLAYVMLFLYTAIPGTRAYEYLSSVFPELDLRTSHERSAFPVGGLTPVELTELRLRWMQEVNGDSSTGLATLTKNWGL